MTLVGDRIGIISLGLSCQTAFQLWATKDLISANWRRELAYESCFFNWLLCDCTGLARFIEDYAGRGLAPGDIMRNASETEPLQVRDYRIWLWHEKWVEPVGDEDLRRITLKYDYLLQKFWSLRSLRLRHFIISNCQSNLNDVINFRNLFRFNLSPADASRIESAIDDAFPRGKNIFHYACYRERIENDGPIGYYPMPQDDSEWKGSTENWCGFLSARLARRPGWLKNVRRLPEGRLRASQLK
ncbi:MAG: hypothetical protein ACM3JG_09360 [Thiohalocapsa sp.]